jgi:hypothetical protein
MKHPYQPAANNRPPRNVDAAGARKGNPLQMIGEHLYSRSAPRAAGARHAAGPAGSPAIPRGAGGRRVVARSAAFALGLVLLALPTPVRAQFAPAPIPIPPSPGPASDRPEPATLTQGDYAYTTNAAGEATITDFNRKYSGALSITNTLGGCPVVGIGDGAFQACERLTGVTIPGGVTSIGDCAFCQCSRLTRVAIPKSVTSIGKGAFANSQRVTEIQLEPGNPAYALAEGVLFDKDLTTLLLVPRNQSGSYRIPDSVTQIRETAFAGCMEFTNVVIPDRVTSIGDSAFAECTNLTSVVLPNGLTRIGDSAFRNCWSLANIQIPDSLRTLGESAFRACSGLTSVSIPNGVAGIEMFVFERCSGLTNVSLPDTLLRIKNYAFSGCYGLTRIHLPGSVRSIEAHAFSHSGLASMTIPGSVTSLWDFAFWECRDLASVTIPAGVTSIGNSAFRGCSSLTGVTIPGSVAVIGDNGFADCAKLASVMMAEGVASIGARTFKECAALTTLSLPDSVTQIGASAFEGCRSLTRFTVPGNVTRIMDCGLGSCSRLTAIAVGAGGGAYASVDGVLYDKDLTTLLLFPRGKAGSCQVPESVRNVADSAFRSCSGLTSVVLPKSLAGLESGGLGWCLNLTAITVDAGNAAYASVDGVLYDKSIRTLLLVPRAKAGTCQIPGGVTHLGKAAFYYCGNLTGITIPASVASLGDDEALPAAGAATGAPGVSSSPRTLPPVPGRGPRSPFASCSSLTAITVDPGNAAYASVDGALYDKNLTTLLLFPRAKAGSYTIPASVTRVRPGAFDACASLTGITIPASLTSLGEDDADSGDATRERVSRVPAPLGATPSEPVREARLRRRAPASAAVSSAPLPLPAARSAFGSCSRLTAITVAAGNPAYASLDGVLFNKSLTTLQMFPQGSNVRDYRVPSGVASLRDAAFASCTNLTSVTLPESVGRIGLAVFQDCASLTGVYFEGAPPQGDAASVFLGASQATVYYVPGTAGWSRNFGSRPTAPWTRPAK